MTTVAARMRQLSSPPWIGVTRYVVPIAGGWLLRTKVVLNPAPHCWIILHELGDPPADLVAASRGEAT